MSRSIFTRRAWIAGAMAACLAAPAAAANYWDLLVFSLLKGATLMGRPIPVWQL